MPLYQGIIGGGSSPVEPLAPVLLWTNPNPSAVFASQTVELDLTNYVGVIVEYNASNGDTFIPTRTYIKKTDIFEQGTFKLTAGFVNRTSSGDVKGRTIMSLNDTGIEFGDAYTGGTVTNAYIIPVRIYGVKEYIIEPVGGNYTMYANVAVSNKGVNTSAQTSFAEWNISSLVSNYNNLTNDDVYVTMPANGYNAKSMNEGAYTITKTYDASTGIVRLSSSSPSATLNSAVDANIFVKNK